MSDITYKVQIEDRAEKALKSLEKKNRERARNAIDQLAENPRPNNSKPLKGFSGIWRLRIGDYRIIYEIRDAELIVLVVEIGHRREVYRGM